jgi:hypothetical protein
MINMAAKDVEDGGITFYQGALSPDLVQIGNQIPDC